MKGTEVNNVKRDDRIGETRIAKNGMKMTIIEYHNRDDIVVRFQDGYIKRTIYRNFISGKVGNPNCNPNHVGETCIAKNGMKMTIIEYNNAQNIVVKFKDGYTKRTNYKQFICREVRNPNCIPNHVGETNIAKNGMKMTIIEYHSADNIVVQFEDGYVTKRTQYKHFISGKVGNPNCNPNHVGETNIANNGLLMTIIEYRNNANIIVQFEDGYIKRTIYSNFIHRLVGHPVIKKNKRKSFNYHGLTCNFIYSDKTDYYYVCKCPKCGYDEILSAKEMAELGDHKCKEI